MSNILSATTQPAAPVALPDPVHVFDLDDFPVYVMHGNQFDHIEQVFGHNHYFVIAGGNEKFPQNTTPATVYVKDMVKVYKVVNSVFGRAILDATVTSTKINFATAMQFNLALPKIPYDLFMRMDAFFRAIHKKHGTEAILMLMYDTNYLGTETPGLGWGAVAPVQKNTAGFCDYDPGSIIDSLEDHVILAGSAHSHPEMSAFASGTDHQDQAGWDGIHITYGWQRHINGGATQHYVETQYAGHKWTYTIEELIETAPVPNYPEDELSDWMSSVSKTVHTPVHHGYTGGAGLPKSQSPSYNSAGGSSSAKPGLVLQRIPVKMPANAPDPSKHMIVGTVVSNGSSSICPFCESPLNDRELQNHRCFACYSFVIESTQDISDINVDRELAGAKYIPQLDVAKSDLPIVIWNGLNGPQASFSEDLRIGGVAKK